MPGHSENKLLTPNFPTPEKINRDILEHGFAIYHDVITKECISEMRRFWCNEFKWQNVKGKVVRGDLRIGEPNYLTYTDSKFWCLYRQFDFLWNPPTHDITTRLGIEVHKIRNQAQGFDSEYGLTYVPDRYGIYMSTSWYQPNQGHLESHIDGHKDTPILQYMLPITQKGNDFDGGGLFVKIGEGPKIDVDELMKSGSIVFFDARNHHGVDKITCSDPMMKGRIATFAIPTFFRGQDEVPASLRKAQDIYYWFKRKLIYFHKASDS